MVKISEAILVLRKVQEEYGDLEMYGWTRDGVDLIEYGEVVPEVYARMMGFEGQPKGEKIFMFREDKTSREE